MPFCIGGKACRRAECKQRCKGWFGAQPDLERACKNACGSDHTLTKDDFLCSGNWIDQAVVIGGYGYDPCAGGIAIEDYFDPLDDRERQDKELSRYTPVLIGAGVMIIIALIILYLIIK